MRRREFVARAGETLAAWPLPALAQLRTGQVARIGFLGAATAAAFAPRIDALRAGLRDLGYEEGKNLVINYRWAEGRFDRLPGLAAELVQMNVDVIVTHAHPATIAAKQATARDPIPVVMTNVGDAVANGIVASLARPGENITGDTFFLPELAAKRLEVLKDALPHARRVAALVNPDNPGIGPIVQAMESAAATLRLEFRRCDASSLDGLDDAFAGLVAQQVDALVVIEDATTTVIGARQVADTAARQRLPTIGFGDFARSGGLLGYGVDFLALYRRAAYFVDRILKGSKPADIPVERPTKFELVLNLATAKLLGLRLTEPLVARADEVIE